MGQIIYIQTTGCDIGSNQQLQVLDTELLHHIITLCLTQFAVQRISIVSVLDQFICYFLRFLTCPAENDGINIRIEVGDTF